MPVGAATRSAATCATRIVFMPLLHQATRGDHAFRLLTTQSVQHKRSAISRPKSLTRVPLFYSYASATSSLIQCNQAVSPILALYALRLPLERGRTSQSKRQHGTCEAIACAVTLLEKEAAKSFVVCVTRAFFLPFMLWLVCLVNPFMQR